MTEHFNGLSPAHAERIALLLEECGEVVQICGKILRHGEFSYHPGNPNVPNRQILEREIGDVICAIELMQVNGDISETKIDGFREDKHVNVRQYLHHN